MKRQALAIFGLLTLTILSGFARGDPNIYGPGGVNLGPNGELPPSAEELQKDKLLKEERERNRLLEEQIQQLQQQVQKLLQLQQEMQWSQQSPLNIQINTGYPQQNYGWGWGWGYPYFGSGFGGITLPTGGGQHGGGGGGHHGGGGGGGGHR